MSDICGPGEREGFGFVLGSHSRVEVAGSPRVCCACLELGTILAHNATSLLSAEGLGI